MKKQLFIALLLALVGAMVLLPITAVFAEEEKLLHVGVSNAKEGTTNSSYDQFDLEPGQTITKTFRFYNLGSKDFRVNLSVSPFSISGEDYIEDQTTQTIHTSISRWITFPRNNFIMKANTGTYEEIEYTVTVPDNPPTGAQRARISVTASLEGEDVGMFSKATVGYTIFANVVGGNTDMDIELVQQDIQFFYFSSPIGDSIRIENSGNIDVPIRHQLLISGFFNDELIYDSEKKDSFILSETTRQIQQKWTEAPMLGIFKVRSIVEINGETFEKEGISLVIPLFVIIIFLLIVALFIVSVVMKVKKRKRQHIF